MAPASSEIGPLGLFADLSDWVKMVSTKSDDIPSSSTNNGIGTQYETVSHLHFSFLRCAVRFLFICLWNIYLVPLQVIYSVVHSALSFLMLIVFVNE